MMPPMQGANMPEMQGANMPQQGGMPPEAMLDSAISPETARILIKLLPELAELINAVSGEGQQMQEEMGALSNMG